MSAQLMAGILQGFQASQDRLTQIGAARDKKRQDDETFASKQKINKLKIDQLEMMGALDKGAAENERKRQKLEGKLYDAQSEINDNLINDVFSQTKAAQDNLRQVGSVVAQSLMPQRQNVYTPGKGFSNISVPKAKAASAAAGVPAVDKVMGVLQSGGTSQGGGMQPFEDKTAAEAYASQNLGVGWEKKYPQARGFIEDNFSQDQHGYTKGQIRSDFKQKGKFQYIGNNQWKQL